MALARNLLRSSCVAILAFMWTPGLQAQPRTESPGPMPQSVFFEVVRLFSSDSTRQLVDIHYRVDESFFIAVKNTDSSFHHAFRRDGEVLVELTDSVSGAVSRNLDRVLIGDETEEPSQFPRKWSQGIMSFSLRPGVYALNFEVTDHESRHDFADRTRMVRVPKPVPGEPGLSDLVFITNRDEKEIPARIVPANFGGDAVFGAPMGVLLEVSSRQPDSSLSVHIAINSIPPSAGEKPEVSMTDSLVIAPGRGCRLTPMSSDEQIMYTVTRNEPNAPSVILLPFPGSKMLLRTYTMTVTIRQGGKLQKTSKHFRMIWPDMPASLKDVDYALDILRYITTSSLLDSLKRGSYEERRENLETFWKAKDETPGTVYNEVMTEYYRRVDHAMKSFGTLRVPDGAKSDRGKVYILYGPPSRTRRTLDPNSAFEEVWVYDRLNREFTFVDRNRNGTYELTETARQ